MGKSQGFLRPHFIRSTTNTNKRIPKKRFMVNIPLADVRLVQCDRNLNIHFDKRHPRHEGRL
jgi:hypothetical protein